MLKTVQHYSILNELSVLCDKNQHLLTYLPYITFKKSVSSFAAHKDFELIKYSKFLLMSKNETGTGLKPLLDTFMKPMKKDVDLPTEVLELLVEYYCNAYITKFFLV